MKKTSVLSVVSFLLFSPQAYALTGDVAPYGDPDGEIDTGDAAIISQIARKKRPLDLKADVAPLGEPDGEVNIGDAALVTRFATRKPTKVSIEYTGSGIISGYEIQITTPEKVVLLDAGYCKAAVPGSFDLPDHRAKPLSVSGTLGDSVTGSLFTCYFVSNGRPFGKIESSEFILSGKQFDENGKSFPITSDDYKVRMGSGPAMPATITTSDASQITTPKSPTTTEVEAYKEAVNKAIEDAKKVTATATPTTSTSYASQSATPAPQLATSYASRSATATATTATSNSSTLTPPTTITISDIPGVPKTSTTQPKVVTSGEHTVVLKRDGTVWTWKNDNPTPSRVDGLANIIDIAAGYHHNVALKKDGSVWTWGGDTSCQLGHRSDCVSYDVQVVTLGRNASFASNWIPTQVPLPTIGIVAVAAGDSHTIALEDNGTVWGWGSNDRGQLGDIIARRSGLFGGYSMVTSVPSPQRIPGLSGINAIAAGTNHTLALQNGTVWTFGNNENRQLGRTTTSGSTPGQIPNLTNVVAIAADGDYTVVLKNDGTVWEPVRGPISGLAGATAIDVDHFGSVVALRNGAVWEWSSFGTRQLHAASLSGISAVSVGWSYGVAVKNDDTIWAWGATIAPNLVLRP